MRFGLLDGAWIDVAALRLSSFRPTRVTCLTLSFYSFYYIFYRLIVKCLHPLFVGGTIQIYFD